VDLTALTDLSLFLLRLAIAALFASSGWSSLSKPAERAKKVGLSRPATLALGTVEVVSSAALVAGVAIQVAAIALIGVMLGAIYKKIFEWKSGFWGESGQGWYYDVLYLLCNLVILATGGGSWRLLA
jgi:putative oxidoreductase